MVIARKPYHHLIEDHTQKYQLRINCVPNHKREHEENKLLYTLFRHLHNPSPLFMGRTYCMYII